MKLMKKLLPALGMLALSTCMMVTSTFAWFSMNENVTAKDMIIKAKGDQVYLQIVNPKTTKEGYSQTFINGAAQVDAYATVAAATELLPVNVKKATVSGETTTYSPYENGSEFAWVTAIGKAPTANYGNGQTDGYAPVNDQYSVAPHSETTPYYLENDFSIRLDPTAGAASAAGPLRVSSVSFKAGTNHGDAFSKTVCVLVVCGTNAELYSNEDGGTTFKKIAGNDYLAAANIAAADKPAVYAFNNTTGVDLKVYVFFNGDNPNCTLEALAAANKGNLNNYSVDVSFTVAKLQTQQGS